MSKITIASWWTPDLTSTTREIHSGCQACDLRLRVSRGARVLTKEAGSPLSREVRTASGTVTSRASRAGAGRSSRCRRPVVFVQRSSALHPSFLRWAMVESPAPDAHPSPLPGGPPLRLPDRAQDDRPPSLRRTVIESTACLVLAALCFVGVPAFGLTTIEGWHLEHTAFRGLVTQVGPCEDNGDLDIECPARFTSLDGHVVDRPVTLNTWHSHPPEPIPARLAAPGYTHVWADDATPAPLDARRADRVGHLLRHDSALRGAGRPGDQHVPTRTPITRWFVGAVTTPLMPRVAPDPASRPHNHLRQHLPAPRSPARAPWLSPPTKFPWLHS